MVGLAFTQDPTPPDPGDPDYTTWRDFWFDLRRAALDRLSAVASPERIPKRRQGAYNTTAVSNQGRTFLVDRQTLEGEPTPNAELAWLLHQSIEERRARYRHLLNTDSEIASLLPAWRELEEAEAEPMPDAAASGGTVGAAAAAAAEEEEEEEDSESETEAILRAQWAAKATVAELPPGFDGNECEAEEPFEDSGDEEPDDGESIDGESEEESEEEDEEEEEEEDEEEEEEDEEEESEGESEGIGDAARVHDPHGEDTEDYAGTVRLACPRPSPARPLRARG